MAAHDGHCPVRDDRCGIVSLRRRGGEKRGGGNTERLMTTVRLLKPDAIALTPSYALHLAEWADARGIDLSASSVTRLLTGGEPGGGEPAMRRQLESLWGATVTEVMGIGDIVGGVKRDDIDAHLTANGIGRVRHRGFKITP